MTRKSWPQLSDPYLGADMEILGFVAAVTVGIAIQTFVPWGVGLGILLLSILGGAILFSHFLFGWLLVGSAPGCDPVEIRGWLSYPCR